MCVCVCVCVCLCVCVTVSLISDCRSPPDDGMDAPYEEDSISPDGADNRPGSPPTHTHAHTGTLLGKKKWAKPKMAKYKAFSGLNNKSLVRK